MWLSKSSFVIITVLCLSLGACGFTPLHSQTTQTASAPGSVQLGTIFVENIPERRGQYLRNQLIDQLYTGTNAQGATHSLKIQGLKESITNLGIQRDASSTSAQMTISARAVLIDKNTGKTLINKYIRATNAYDILDSQYTTQVSEQYARERILNELSSQILTQISLYNQGVANGKRDKVAVK